MTETPETDPEGGVAPFTVLPEPGSRLAELQAAYPAAKAAADEAAARLKAITDGIKAELTHAAPEQQRIALAGRDGAPSLQLTYSTRWTFDSKKLKAADPETYVRYAKQGGAWSLRQVTGATGDE